MPPELLTIIGFGLILFGFLIWSKSGNETHLIIFTTVGVMLVTVSWRPPEPLFYKLGNKEYIVEDGKVVKGAETTRIYFWKPDGEVKSYSTVYDTLKWLPPGRILPGANIVFAKKGSPQLTEKLHALRDSVVNPMDTLQNELRSKPVFSQLRAVVMRYDPAVRPVLAPFLRPEWSHKAQRRVTE